MEQDSLADLYTCGAPCFPEKAIMVGRNVLTSRHSMAITATKAQQLPRQKLDLPTGTTDWGPPASKRIEGILQKNSEDA